jgi:Cu/Ag efflux pump CusA
LNLSQRARQYTCQAGYRDGDHLLQSRLDDAAKYQIEWGGQSENQQRAPHRLVG